MNKNYKDKITDIENVIRKYCGSETAVRFQDALNNTQDSVVRIVNTGLVSSGKSSLFNLLTGDETEEDSKKRFKTGAARTTDKANPYTYNNCVYIDTPGIDVRTEDDAVAFSTVMESDIIIMVHNIKTGPLTRNEEDWLKRIVNIINDAEMCRKRIIFVCTWKDTRENETGYDSILNDIKSRIFDICGTEINFFDVSSKKYKSGIDKGINALCSNSGIPSLKSFLEDYSSYYSKEKSKIAKTSCMEIIAEIMDRLGEARTQCETKMSANEAQVHSNFKSRWNSWTSVYDNFKSKRNRYSELLREYNNM